MATFTHGRCTFHKLLVDCHNSRSNTGKAIEQYTNYDDLPTSIPLVTKPDVIQNPQNPCNSYISKWPDGYSGCLACRSTTYKFVSCPNKGNVYVNILFW